MPKIIFITEPLELDVIKGLRGFSRIRAHEELSRVGSQIGLHSLSNDCFVHSSCRDWCISRQLWWGHRIPAYYVSFNDPAKKPKNVSIYFVAVFSSLPN